MHARPASTEVALAPAEAGRRGAAPASVATRCADAGFLLGVGGVGLVVTHAVGALVPLAMVARGLLDRHVDGGLLLSMGVALLIASAGVVGLGLLLAAVGSRGPSATWRTVAMSLAVLTIAMTPAWVGLSLLTTVGAGILGDLGAAVCMAGAIARLLPGEVRVGLEGVVGP